jgi:hypothetical protein
VKSVGICGVAHKLREHFGASAQSVLALFKNKDPRSFTQHKSIAITISWAGRTFRVIVSGRERSHRAKAGNRQWRHGGLASSADHHLRIAPLYDPEGFPDSMCASGTCGSACYIGTSGAILDRDLPTCEVCDGSGNEERRHARRSLRDEFAVFPLDHFEGPDAASNVDSNPFGIFRRNMNRSLSRSIPGSRHRELDEAPHLLNILSLDEVFRYKTLYFAGKSARIVIG